MIKKKIKNVYKMLRYAYTKDRDIKCINVKYGNDKKQYYKVFKCNNNNPTIFFIHGGGWWQGSPSLYSGVGKFLCKHGYTTVLVGYRLVPDYRYPIQIEDAFKALKHYIKHNDNRNIILGGYSAGAEISSHLAFDEKRQNRYKINTSLLKAFISISGVLNFNECDSKRSKRLIKNYVYVSNTRDCNPINFIDKKSNIITLCIHGDSDTLIDVNNSKSFINKLQKVNNKSYIKIIKGYEHEDTIDIIRGNGNEYSKYVFDFLEQIN